MKNLEGLRLKRHKNELKDPWVWASAVALIVVVVLMHNNLL